MGMGQLTHGTAALGDRRAAVVVVRQVRARETLNLENLRVFSLEGALAPPLGTPHFPALQLPGGESLEEPLTGFFRKLKN